MKKKLLWTVIVLIVLALIAGVTLLRPPAVRPIDQNLKGDAVRGAYLTRVGDCVACHTAPGAKPFAGGLAMQSPIGAMYSTNITPDKQTGIGDYTLSDFQRAVRQGIAKDGHPLYPAMPYPAFAKVTDQDVVDLYAYFMQRVQPVSQANHPSDIPWPLNMRWPLLGWITLFTDGQPYQPDVAKGEIWNRGAYLVQGLGHCGACHTPRGITMQEKGMDQSSPTYLTGGDLEGWHTPALNNMPPQVMANWSQQDLTEFLESGRSTHSAVFGSMTSVVTDSTQHMSDADLHDIAVYLSSLNPGMPDKPIVQTVTADATVTALRKGDDSVRGVALYLDNCAACHRTNGKGYAKTFPALAGNSAVNNDDPATLIRVVLFGHAMPTTATAPTNLTMPDFAWRLNDEQVAQLLSFVCTNWGNKGGEVAPGEVGKVRKDWAPKQNTAEGTASR